MRKICARLYFFLQCAIYVQDFTTICAQNIITQQVIKCSIFLFKLTGQTNYNKEKNNQIKGCCLYDEKYLPFRVKLLKDEVLICRFLLYIDLKLVSLQ